MENSSDEMCRNCANLMQLNKHPCNKDFGKGSILEPMGFVCLLFESAIFFELDEDSRECFIRKEEILNTNELRNSK